MRLLESKIMEHCSDKHNSPGDKAGEYAEPECKPIQGYAIEVTFELDTEPRG